MAPASRAGATVVSGHFTVAHQGTVSDFFAAGLVSAALNLHYGNDQAYEFEYSPNSVGSNLCIGVASTAGNKTPVVLVPCGNRAQTA